MYQCCLGDECTEAERVGEDFWPCTLTAAPWQATKASCMDPAAGCRASHRWCWCDAAVRALKRDIAEGFHTEKNGCWRLCCDWINHFWAEPEHTDHNEELQNIYAASTAAPDQLFTTYSVTFICKKSSDQHVSLFLDNVKTQPFPFTSTVPCNLIKPSSHGSRRLRLMKQVEHEKSLPDSW